MCVPVAPEVVLPTDKWVVSDVVPNMTYFGPSGVGDVETVVTGPGPFTFYDAYFSEGPVLITVAPGGERDAGKLALTAKTDDISIEWTE